MKFSQQQSTICYPRKLFQNRLDKYSSSGVLILKRITRNGLLRKNQKMCRLISWPVTTLCCKTILGILVREENGTDPGGHFLLYFSCFWKHKNKYLRIDISQRRQKNSQQAYEMMLSITNHERNANQSHSAMLPHTHQNGFHKKINRK